MLDYRLSGYHGIVLPNPEVGLDVAGPVTKHIFVSHAHADHLPRDRHMQVYATAPTARLMQARGFKGDVQLLEFENPLELDSCRITLYPAGHILGSAMIGIEADDGHTLYTGDAKNPPSPVSEGFSHPPAGEVDYLITEATFGLPIYRWPAQEVLFSDIRQFATDALDEGYTPVFLGYNLGKAQEIMHALSPLDRPIQIHGAGFELCKIYEEFGQDIGSYTRYDRQTVQDGCILVTPSSSLDQPMLSNIRKKRVAYVSGWATHEARRAQMNIDARIPLSDHFDFFELLQFCEALAPKHVYLTHSPNTSIAERYLADKGISASGLKLAATDPED